MDACHIAEVALVHEAAREHVHRAVDVQLVPVLVVREDRVYVATEHRF